MQAAHACIFAIFDCMNDVKLKSCVFNNFMSYGNTANEFTFPDGMVWMTADNGSGKSTLVEAINFALFGRSYRGGKQSELRNTRNVEGTLRVMLEFECTRVADVVETYRVTRSIPPSGTVKFELEKLEGGQWVKQSKRAGFAQKDFEENILGFNEVLFKNDIAMNTQETVPFIEMSAKDRHALLESIIMFNCEPWKKETGSRLSAAMSAFDIAENDYRRLTDEIANLEVICEKMRQEKETNIQQLEQQLATARETESQLRVQLDAVSSEWNEKRSAVAALQEKLNGEASVDRSMAAISTASGEINFLSRYKEDAALAETELKNVSVQYDEMHYDVAHQHVTELNERITQLTARRANCLTQKALTEAQVTSLVKEQNSIAEQGKAIKVTTNCPTCGKPYTEEEMAGRKAEVERQKDELRQKWSALNGQIAGLNNTVASYVTEIADCDNSVSSTKTELTTAVEKENEIVAFYNNTVIPAQRRVAAAQQTIKNSEATIKAAGVDPDSFSAELARLSDIKATFPAIREDWSRANTELTEITCRYQQIDSQVATSRTTINSLTQEIAKAKEKAANDSLAMTEKRLNEARLDMADADLRRHKASDDRKAYEYIKEHICSDDGLKKMIFAHFIPAFNKSVENNIRRLNLPFMIQFDETMDFRFMSEPGLAPSYSMLSQGQRRKLGFAISMAFRDFITAVGNFRINFLSMDEVLDVSTDDSGMREMLDIVRDMVDEIGCALVITHRGQVVADKFDYRIAVEYDGTFSTLGEIEKL